MLRLRSTTSLSVLALALGIAATGVLSTLTADGRGPPSHGVTARHVPPSGPASSAPNRRRDPVELGQVQRKAVDATLARRAKPDGAVNGGDVRVATLAAPAPSATAELVPVAMPSDGTQSWETLRGHLDGRVVLQLSIDGNGRVSAASVAQSSGDAVLDAHALRSVAGWRFAVPTAHPAGISGELPMQFSSRGARLARLP